MKKIYIPILTLLLLNNYILAGNSVKITRILAGERPVPENEIQSLTLTPQQTLTIYYAVENPSISSAEIDYKAFLNAKLTETISTSSDENYTILTSLEKGQYIFKVQAFGKGNWEANPAIMQFSVGDITSINSGNNKVNTIMQNGIELKTIILYGLIAVSLIQLIVISIIFLKKRKHKDTETSIKRNFKDPENNRITIPEERELSQRKNAELIQELKELHLSYNQLKKELDNMKGANNFLQNQIASLQLNVKNLEAANVELAGQKDKLLESKRQLQELQTQKDELFAMAVHDIKNPAAAIRSYVELLDSYDLNANEQQEIMQSLVDTSSRIVNLAQQMSVIIAQQAPEPPLTLEPASIKTLIDSICNRNYAYAKRKNIKLINNSSPHTPKTLLDISKMEEVIDNLINNAIKFAPEETIVQVRTFFSDSKITVEVEDNGVGLSEQDIKKAFEKGVKLASKPTAGETSSGLGLWIVKNVIEEHGGSVWVKSKQGVGSTFGFELPMVKK